MPLMILSVLAVVAAIAISIWLLGLMLRQNGQLLVRVENLEAATSPVLSGREPWQSAIGSPAGSLPLLIATSVSTTKRRELLVRWEAEAKQLSDPVSNDNRIILHGDKTHYLTLADGEIGPVIAREDDVGLFMVYDWSTREVIWQHSWGAKVVAPFGFCFADGVLYLADLWGCGVLQVDLTEQPGRLLKRLSHPSMSDLHSVRRSKRGLLIACTGTDMILEIDTDGTVLYEWWAGDHGYTTSAAGVERLPQHGREHRDQHYHTRFHTTHVNDAVFRDADERYLLAVFFHQGQIVQIDRSLPPECQTAEVLVDGMLRPHGLKRTPEGWLVSSSASNEVLFFDEDFRLIDRLHFRSGWIHDCTLLSSGDLLVNDAGRCQLIQFRGPPWHIVNVTPYSEDYRLYGVIEVPPEYETGFRSAVPLDVSSAPGNPVGSCGPAQSVL